MSFPQVSNVFVLYLLQAVHDKLFCSLSLRNKKFLVRYYRLHNNHLLLYCNDLKIEFYKSYSYPWIWFINLNFVAGKLNLFPNLLPILSQSSPLFLSLCRFLLSN
jgi:hypothetical protein